MGRENVLPVVTYKILDNLGISNIIDEDKLTMFMDQIFLQYSRKV